MGVRKETEARKTRSTAIVSNGPEHKPSGSHFVPTAMELCRAIVNLLKKGRLEQKDLQKAVANKLDFPSRAIKTKYPSEGGASFANNFQLAIQHLRRSRRITQSGKLLSAVLDMNGRAPQIPEMGSVDPGQRNAPNLDRRWPIDLEVLKAELPTLPIGTLLVYFHAAADYNPPNGKKRLNCMMNSVIAGSHVQHELVKRGVIRDDGTVNKAAFARALGYVGSDLAFHWPSTKNTEGDGSMIMPDVPDISPLKLMGYTVGRNGLGQSERRRLLTKAFHGPIPDAPEIDAWDKPNTSGRLKKIAYHLALLTRNDKRKRTRNMSEAISMREDDLEFLRVNFYVGKFDSDWTYPSP